MLGRPGKATQLHPGNEAAQDIEIEDQLCHEIVLNFGIIDPIISDYRDDLGVR
jgi:hypothetical protein